MDRLIIHLLIVGELFVIACIVLHGQVSYYVAPF